MEETKICFYCKEHKNPYNPNSQNFKLTHLTENEKAICRGYKIVDMHNECARIDELEINITIIEDEIDDIKNKKLYNESEE